jgi:protein ImuB
LADWSLQFSSTVHVEPARWLIWLEIGASLRYFEGLPALRSRIELGVSALRYSASIGIAPSLEAAALFALSATALTATAREQIKPLAASLPLMLLAVDHKVIEQLRATGLTTIGELLAIPAAALARRFGPEVTPTYNDFWESTLIPEGSIVPPRPTDDDTTSPTKSRASKSCYFRCVV